MRLMVQHASQAFSFGTLNTTQGENFRWHSWVLSECIRRTWVIASGIHGIYAMIQRGGPAPCMGGMMFTTCQGVWEARSALAWENICLESNVGLIQPTEAHNLFKVAPDLVDDFSKFILEVAFGTEKLERWGVRIPNDMI